MDLSPVEKVKFLAVNLSIPNKNTYVLNYNQLFGQSLLSIPKASVSYS